MFDVSSILDPYAFRARFLPMVIVLAPLVLGIGCWFSGSAEWQALAGGMLVTLALGALAGQVARDAGKRKEQALFALWGGKPSVLGLSYSGTPVDAITLKRIHDNLRSRAPGIGLPADHSEELIDIDRAMTAYQSANELLINFTRDKVTNRLVFEENVNYGFRRNLWGMKPSGIVSSVLGITGGTMRMVWEISNGSHFIVPGGAEGVASAVALGLSACLFVLWTLRITPSWVKVPADAYALQLIRAADKPHDSNIADTAGA